MKTYPNQCEKDSVTITNAILGAVAVVAGYVLAVMLLCF